MKKLLLMFLFFALLLLLSVYGYTKYCNSEGIECKNYVFDEKDFGPQKGIDW